MRNRNVSTVIYIIIGLAVVGLISQLLTNTTNFLLNILVMIGVGAAIFAAFYFLFLRRRVSSSDMKKYKQAVKQSKVKYKQPGNMSVTHTQKPHSPLKKKSKKRANHLRVIDGNKQKRKKRASN